MNGTYTNLDLHILLCRAHRIESWASGNLAAPYWRLYWNETPGMYVCPHGGEKVGLGPDRIVLIPPDMSYSPELTKPSFHLYIHYIIKAPVYAAAERPYCFPVASGARGMIDDICGLANLEGGNPSLRLSLLCASLVHYALAGLPEEAFDISYSDSRIEKSLERMRDTLGEKISNQSLAREAGMNTNSFIRLFKQVVGETPQAKLARLRIDQACLLLCYTDKTVDEIAEETGFCDRYHFTRVFKKLRRIGPASFRKNMEPTAQLNLHSPR